MSDDRDRAIATATATSEETPYGAHKLADVAEKTPVTRVVRS